MWLTADMTKPLTLRKLLTKPQEMQQAKPEPLAVACLVTDGIQDNKHEWLLDLERLASEKDNITLENKLQKLLSQNKSKS